MCGIAGLYAPDTSLEQLEDMLSSIHHRGPDDHGTWQDGGQLLLGQQRLAIIDLTPGGHQPMLSPDQRYAITFNGEIYNFQELRQELQSQGIVFQSESDTEVILRGYEHWGERVVERLVGMFAFALWDRQERRLFLARDRAGEKPLYYAHNNERLAFASEVAALKNLPWVDYGIDEDALALYLHYQYVPAPHSIYRGIQKLPPAHAMSFANGKVKVWRYWDPFAFAAQPDRHLALPAALDQLEALLKQSIRGQLISDVPLGAFLSGGVDSSLVVALMTEQSKDQVRTFTIGFDVPEFNEADHAAAVAKHLGTDHTVEYLTERDTLNMIPMIPTMYGEPFGDSSALPTALVSQVAKQHVTVSLSGDGGDEAFGGYTRYDLLEQYARPLRLLRPVAPLLRSVRGALPGKARRVVDAAGRSEKEVFRHMISVYTPEQVKYLTDRQPTLDLFDQAWAMHNLSARRKAMLADLVTYMPEAIMVKVDRAAMSCSLETRAPFLDHRVLEFSLRLPPGLLNQKQLLRELLYRRVPRELIDRPKQGFAVPLGRWFRNELRELLQDTVTASRLQEVGIHNPHFIDDLMREHQSGKANHAAQLWLVLVLCMWGAEHAH